MFGKETILVKAKVLHKYAGGGYDEVKINHAFDVPEGTSKNLERLAKVGEAKLLSAIGKEHEIFGEVIATDNEGFTKSAKFNYRPTHEKMLVPAGYTKAEPKQKKSFDYSKIVKGASAVSKAFDKLMGEEPKKKSTQTNKKRKATTNKSKSTKSSSKKKTTSKSRKTNKR